MPIRNSSTAKIIAISGGVASGKNLFVEIFAKNYAKKNQLLENQILVFDADFEVHKIYQSNQNIKNKIAEIFPSAFIDNQINRSEIAKIVFGDEKKMAAEKLTKLEEIIHPEVQKKYQNLINNLDEKTRLVILNIPLLTRENSYDYDLLISIIVDEEIRKKRFFQRFKNSNKSHFLSDEEIEKRFYQIKNNQISDQERIKKSDVVIYNNSSISDFEKEILSLAKRIYSIFN